MEINIPLAIIAHIVFSIMIFYVGDLPEIWKENRYNVFLPTIESIFPQGRPKTSEEYENFKPRTMSVAEIKTFLEDFYNPAANYIRAVNEYDSLYKQMDGAHFVPGALIHLFFLGFHFISWVAVWNSIFSGLIAVAVFASCILIGYLIFRLKIKLEGWDGECLDDYKARFSKEPETPQADIEKETRFNQFVIDHHWLILRQSLTVIKKKYEVWKILNRSVFIIPILMMHISSLMGIYP